MVEHRRGWSVQLRALRVEAGSGALAVLPDLVREAGCRRVLVVTDRGIQRAGHIDRVLSLLEEEVPNVACEVFSDVEESPTEQNVAMGAESAKRFAPDLVVAIGGGSAMDCAKGINFIHTNGGRMEDYWGFGKATRPMLPSIGVPCSTGTGSEAQSFALISRDNDHLKMACGDEKARFRTVILDSTLAATQPKEVLALTAMDAVSHAVETYVTKSRNPVSQQFARGAWSLLSERVDELVKEKPRTDELWLDMLTGAHLAGAAIETSMLGAAHALANPISASCDLAHGSAVAIMLPAVVRWNAEADPFLYRGLGPIPEVVPEELTMAQGERLAKLIEFWRSALDVPATLAEVGIREEELEVLAGQAAEQWTGRHNPRQLTAEHALTLYQVAFDGAGLAESAGGLTNKADVAVAH